MGVPPSHPLSRRYVGAIHESPLHRSWAPVYPLTLSPPPLSSSTPAHGEPVEPHERDQPHLAGPGTDAVCLQSGSLSHRPQVWFIIRAS